MSLLFVLLLNPGLCSAQAPEKTAPDPPPDVLVLANGDTLHGKLVKEVGGNVTFHTDAIGDIGVPWDKIKELHANQPFAVLSKTAKMRGKKQAATIPLGTLDADRQAITVHPANAAVLASIPIGDAQFIVDEPTLEEQLNREPNFFTGWNGSATAGATLVAATQNQNTVSGGLGIMRVVPAVPWMNPRQRTSADFSGSYGKITQPAYFSGGVFVPKTVTKTAIYHIGGERDRYLSKQLFALAQVAFDHNFAQNLQLQQTYGGGLGWTLFNTPRHTADLKATLQYEKQTFINASAHANKDLIGSTFSADYILRVKHFTCAQTVAYIPAYNTPRAYSANETDSVTFPAYKNLGFSVGTIDSYLNDSPPALPPTKRNSFQFTMGLTYVIKSNF